MPTQHARIETPRAERYLAQLCKHARAVGEGRHSPRMHLHTAVAGGDVTVTVASTDEHATLDFVPWGRCVLTADATALSVRIDASDEDSLRKIQDIVNRDLTRFSSRDPLTVAWSHGAPDTTGDAATGGAPMAAHQEPSAALGRILNHRTAAVLTIGVLLAIGLHLGLAGTLLANYRDKHPYGRGYYQRGSGSRLSVALAHAPRMSGRHAGPVATALTARLSPGHGLAP